MTSRVLKIVVTIILSLTFGWYAHVLWTSDSDRGVQFQLNAAARWGDISGIERLVRMGADPAGRAVAENGCIDAGTAIDAAAGAGQPEAVAWLLAHGADPNQTDIDMSVLEIARSRLVKTQKTIEILLQHGAKESK